MLSCFAFWKLMAMKGCLSLGWWLLRHFPTKEWGDSSHMGDSVFGACGEVETGGFASLYLLGMGIPIRVDTKRGELERLLGRVAAGNKARALKLQKRLFCGVAWKTGVCRGLRQLPTIPPVEAVYARPMAVDDTQRFDCYSGDVPQHRARSKSLCASEEQGKRNVGTRRFVEVVPVKGAVRDRSVRSAFAARCLDEGNDNETPAVQGCSLQPSLVGYLYKKAMELHGTSKAITVPHRRRSSIG
ncbi:uncharacterized protein EI90DRAFT_3286994 [Cantharellus anzutake]|uniref:uncharacterized protein n=1 Tax=Cantharellus anzutake TaxID=1750568 RepID=UPI0019076802|nr:uncharacterized protein EI90DRAFT_3286994 [Cantharellus anzutake]KAF8337351.1 hypothetical protein EI90DRAFT_3286994 [Cantharellus anzutake]